MRKVAILVAMLAMVLVAAAPAFADVDIDDSFNTYVGALQAVDQDATATQDNDVTVQNNVAGDDVNTAVANDQSIDQSAVQYADDYYYDDYYFFWGWW